MTFLPYGIRPFWGTCLTRHSIRCSCPFPRCGEMPSLCKPKHVFMCHCLSSSRAAAHIPTFLSKRTSSARSPDLNTAIVSSMSVACFWKARSIRRRPVSVSSTIRLRRSFGSDVLRSSSFDSRRSTAAVIEPLVSNTFFPMIFTG